MEQQPTQRPEPNERTKKIFEQFLAEKGINSKAIDIYNREKLQEERNAALSAKVHLPESY